MPLFVLQDRLCSVHAAGAFPGGWRRLSAVNVKLTMRLGIGAGLLMAARSDARRSFQGVGEVVTEVASNRFGGRAGRGGDVARFPCARRSAQTREGFLRARPFFFGVPLLATIPDLALQHQAA